MRTQKSLGKRLEVRKFQKVEDTESVPASSDAPTCDVCILLLLPLLTPFTTAASRPGYRPTDQTTTPLSGQFRNGPQERNQVAHPSLTQTDDHRIIPYRPTGPAGRAIDGLQKSA